MRLGDWNGNQRTDESAKGEAMMETEDVLLRVGAVFMASGIGCTLFGMLLAILKGK